MDGEPVVRDAGVVLDRAVVDVLAGVVADRSRCAGAEPEGEVALVGAEHDAVQVVDGVPSMAPVSTMPSIVATISTSEENRR